MTTTPSPTAQWRIVTADDHQDVSNHLKPMLETAPNIQVVAQAMDGKEAVSLCRQYKPDLLLIDMRMPVLDGPSAIAELKRSNPAIPCLVLSSHADTTSIFDALKAGAAGYVLKESAADVLIDKIGDAITGEPVLDANETGAFVTQLTNEGGVLFPEDEKPPWLVSLERDRRAFDELPPRELEILIGVGRGWTNPQIGTHLHISKYTVKNYIEALMPKFKTRDRTQMIARALAIGVISFQQLLPENVPVRTAAGFGGPNDMDPPSLTPAG